MFFRKKMTIYDSPARMQQEIMFFLTNWWRSEWKRKKRRRRRKRKQSERSWADPRLVACGVWRTVKKREERGSNSRLLPQQLIVEVEEAEEAAEGVEKA